MKLSLWILASLDSQFASGVLGLQVAVTPSCLLVPGIQTLILMLAWSTFHPLCCFLQS